ncbi:alpha/beta fold hydrolase [Clostridium sp. CF012]|uniref:alpha/beta fold hydrolase n=1 Tax=Clostridium sp. CF012 TaxID=2843319 RepID=UPI001C0C2DBF|nr:alpha/beta fold hydrolase [Clostridium sp. CF012]MBU3143800.1 alpha/beta hydrolase [Clostridium sp. CF012]
MNSKYIISADGAKIAYNVFGKGLPLVLVHGMGSNKEMWVDRGWIEIFKNYFTVITIDIRGNGESDKSYNPNFYSANNILEDINIVVNECGFNEYSYFGHSYGATIGLQLCKRNKNIKKVVCGGSIFGNKFFKEIVPEWINEYESLHLKKKNNMLDQQNLSKDDVEWIEKTDFNLAIAQLKAWANWEGIEVKDIKTSLAVYSGTEDNPQVLENLKTNEIEIRKNDIALKIFDKLNHSDLVGKADIVSPWVLDFLLK